MDEFLIVYKTEGLLILNFKFLKLQIKKTYVGDSVTHQIYESSKKMEVPALMISMFLLSGCRDSLCWPHGKIITAVSSK